MKQSHLKALRMSLRLPFLLLTPVCLLLGFVLAYHSMGFVDIYKMLLVLLGGISAHASVNLFNEFSDYQSGLDKLTSKTPFSGGSGGLLIYPHALRTVQIWAVINLMITIAIGLYFVFTVSFMLLPLGMVGVPLVIFYTEHVNRWPWLCLIAPGLAFGPIMVLGAYIALTGQFSYLVLLVSVIPFLMVNNLLLLNQLPDIQADQQIGRENISIRYGWKISLLIYALFNVAVIVTLWLLKAENIITDNWGWIWLPGLLSLIVLIGLYRHQYKTVELIPYLGINVLTTLITPVMLSLSLN